MTDTQHDPEIPEAVVEPKRRHSFQLVWLIPLVAAIVGATLAVKTYLNRGPTITITFKSGEGLEAGKTKIKYKEVEVGTVKEIRLSKDLKRVVATAELVKGATPYLVEDTKFWVVTPRISGGTVTGLGTLMGGAYIGIDIGKSTKARREFEALDIQPVVTMDQPGSRYQLHGQDIGSVNVGTPLYFRRIQVGQVLSYKLDQDGKGVTFTIFVEQPYDKYVKMNTRFWHASGIDLAVDANGFKLNTESVASILVGGIAFQTPDEEDAAPPPDPNMMFTLFPNRDEAMKMGDTFSKAYTMIFKESVRGLTVGAPVDFRGVVIGEVTAIQVQYGGTSRSLDMVVQTRIYPERMRSRSITLHAPTDQEARRYLNQMVDNGLRAQLKSGNLVTGQLYISLDFFPTATKAKIAWNKNPPEFPTTPSSIVELQATIAKAMKKFEQLPLDEIIADVRQAVRSLDATLKSTDQMIKRVNGEVLPEVKSTVEEARKTLSAAKQTLAEDAPAQQDLRQTLRELGRAAQSLRILTDYLERHPESIIRGKTSSKGE